MNLQELITSLPVTEGDRLPVIFNGRIPRLIGYANSRDQADWLAFSQRLSATYNSLAELDGRRVIILWG